MEPNFPKLNLNAETLKKYQHLYGLADLDKDGGIGLNDVHNFFSKLDRNVMSSIWKEQDQFFILLSLVTLASRGRPPTLGELQRRLAPRDPTASSSPALQSEAPQAAPNLQLAPSSVPTRTPPQTSAGGNEREGSSGLPPLPHSSNILSRSTPIVSTPIIAPPPSSSSSSVRLSSSSGTSPSLSPSVSPSPTPDSVSPRPLNKQLPPPPVSSSSSPNPLTQRQLPLPMATHAPIAPTSNARHPASDDLSFQNFRNHATSTPSIRPSAAISRPPVDPANDPNSILRHHTASTPSLASSINARAGPPGAPPRAPASPNKASSSGDILRDSTSSPALRAPPSSPQRSLPEPLRPRLRSHLGVANFQALQEIAAGRSWDWNIQPYMDTIRALFSHLEGNTTGKLTKDQFFAFAKEARIDLRDVERVWGMADIRRDGTLNRSEFYVCCMLLLSIILGHSVPSALPQALLSSLASWSRSENRNPPAPLGSPPISSSPVPIPMQSTSPRDRPPSVRYDRPLPRRLTPVLGDQGERERPSTRNRAESGSLTALISPREVGVFPMLSTDDVELPEPSRTPGNPLRMSAILTSTSDSVDNISPQHIQRIPSRRALAVKSLDSITSLYNIRPPGQSSPRTQSPRATNSPRGTHSPRATQSPRITASPSSVDSSSTSWPESESPASPPDHSPPLHSPSTSPRTIVTNRPSSPPTSPRRGRRQRHFEHVSDSDGADSKSWRASFAPGSIRPVNPPTTTSREGFGGVNAFRVTTANTPELPAQQSPELPNPEQLDFISPSTRLKRKAWKGSGKEFTLTKNAFQKKLSTQDLAIQMAGDVKLYPGEALHYRLDGAFLKYADDSPPLHGKIFLTNYRVVFHTAYSKTKVMPDFSVPLTTIFDVTTSKTITPDHLPVSESRLLCKDLREVVFQMHSETHHEELVNFVNAGCVCQIEERFCFNNDEIVRSRLQVPDHIYQASNELERTNATSLFSIVDNSDFSISSHASLEVVVPSMLAKQRPLLQAAAEARSRQRLITWSWGRYNGHQPSATLLRCDRPLHFASNLEPLKRVPAMIPDTSMIEAVLAIANHPEYRHSNDTLYPQEDTSILVIDTGRSHDVLGRLYDCYCGTDFLELGNEPIENSIDLLFGVVRKTPSSSTLEEIERTGWVRFVHKLLKVSSHYANTLNNGRLIVVQSGGPGYDTDGTIVSLIQLLLDPYYRTYEGFCVLIDKDWVCYGYNFAGDASASQSAIFLNFLHCVWAIMQEHPHRFEFNEDFLLFLTDCIYDSRFGTFLFENEKARAAFQPLPSVWDYLKDPVRVQTFANPFYQPINEILPLIKAPHFRPAIWTRYLLRWNWTVLVSYHSVLQKVASIKTAKSRDADDVSLKLLNSFYYFTDELDKSFNFLRILQLSNNCVSSLPTGLPYLVDLTRLSLDTNKLVVISPLISRLSSLTYLSIRDNHLTKLPAEIGNFPNLTTLHLDKNRITSIPNTISGLSNLKICTLNENGLDFLPSTFVALTKLTVLQINKNKLKYFPAAVLQSATSLQTLALSENSLTQLPESIGRLESLTDLNVSANKIDSVPSSLGNLSSLVVLFLSKNPSLTVLPKRVNWNSISVIDLTACSIVALPENIGICTNLRRLILPGCQLQELPHGLRTCRKLNDLNVANNRIKKLTLAVGQLRHLKQLNLSGNPIQELPPTIAYMTNLQNLFLQGTSLPAVVLEMDTPLVISYLRSMLKRSEPTNRLKLMVVGQDKVGKTSIIKVLARKWIPIDGESYRPDLDPSSIATVPYLSTDGIKISSYAFGSNEAQKKEKFGLKLGRKKGNSRNMIVHVWDFAGQEVYYTTHQFFLSSWAVYLVVYDLTEPDSELKVEFWLQSIKVRDPITKARVISANVLIAGTHADTMHESLVEERIEQLKQRIARVFGNAFAFVQIFAVSCTVDIGIDRLRTSIQDIVANHKEVNKPVPNSFVLLEELLVEYRTECKEIPMISRDQLVRFGSICGMTEIEEVMKCARMLHEFGTIVYFDKDPLFFDMVILDPRWLTNAMATLLTTKHTFVKNGLLEHFNLPHIWKEYPSEMHASLLYLLQKFEIAFVIRSQLQEGMMRTLKRSVAPVGHRSSMVPQPAREERRLSEAAEQLDMAASSLIPAMLPTTRPAAIERYWSALPTAEASASGTSPNPRPLNPNLMRVKGMIASNGQARDTAPAPNTPYIQFDRTYQFLFVPNGLFSRLLVRLLHLAGSRAPDVLWADGIISTYQAESHRGRYFMELVTKKEEGKNTKETAIVIQARSEIRSSAAHIFIKLIELLDALLDDWPQLRYDTYCWSPRDLSNSSQTPARISIQDLEQHLIRGAIKIRDPSNLSELVYIHDIAPDLVLEGATSNSSYVPYQEIKDEQQIGMGGFATVSRAIWRDTVVAVKKLTYAPDLNIKERSKVFRSFRSEANIMLKLNHPNIVKVLGLISEPFAIILEFIQHGNLYDLVMNLDNSLCWRWRLQAAMNMAKALEYIHTLDPPLVHRDFKSPNVLVVSTDPNATNVVSVTDFGTGRFLSEAMPLGGRLVDNPVWQAPELLANSTYNEKVDTYAYGIICWELVSRDGFFSEFTFLSDIQDLVMDGKRPAFPAYTPAQYRELVEQLWHQESSERPEWPHVINTINSLLAQHEAIDARFIEAEQIALEDRARDARLQRELEERLAIQQQQDAHRRKVVLEADQARLDMEKLDQLEPRKPESKHPAHLAHKRMRKLIKSTAIEAFDQLLYNEESFKVFEAYLLQQCGTADDIFFFRRVLEFREQLFMSKDLQRKNALGIASQYLGLSANSECRLFFVSDKTKIDAIVNKLLAGTDISTSVFDELFEEVGAGLREKYNHFLWVVETRRRRKSNSQVHGDGVMKYDMGVNKQRGELSFDKFTFSEMVSEPELLHEFESFLRMSNSHDLLSCYIELINFQSSSFPSRAAMLASAESILERWFTSSSNEPFFVSLLNPRNIETIRSSLSHKIVSQSTFSEVLFEVTQMLDERWIKMGGKPTVSRKAAVSHSVVGHRGSMPGETKHAAKKQKFRMPFVFKKK